MSSPKILLLLLQCSSVASHFHLAGRSLLAPTDFSFSHRHHEIFMIFFQRNSSPLFLITRSRSLSLIYVNVEIKITLKKT